MKPAAPVTSTAPFTVRFYQALRESTLWKCPDAWTIHRASWTRCLTAPRPATTLRFMDDKHYRALLEAARVSQDGPWAVMTEERTITLHVASGGVGLNISKVVRLRSEGLLLHAENAQGEVFVLSLGDVYAASIDGGKKAGRKAGFAT